MKYNGIIKKEIKDYAKGILNSNDEGRETQELCFEAIRQIQAALIETRQPFFDNVDAILLKYDINENAYHLFNAKKELNDISITHDLEAERLIQLLIKKYLDNK